MSGFHYCNTFSEFAVEDITVLGDDGPVARVVSARCVDCGKLRVTAHEVKVA